MKKTELIAAFLAEVQKSLLLEDEDKKYWLENAQNLLPEVLESVYNVVKNKNDLMDSYINAALADDPDHEILRELKLKIKTIESGSQKIAEEEQQLNAEEMLVEEIAKL